MLSHSSPQTESYRRTGEVFKQQTGIGLEITEVPFNELQPKMMTELLAKTGTYDVIPITNAMLYAAAPYLEDLSALFTPELTKDLSPASIEHCRDLEGVLRGVPTLNSLPANFYRTDLLQEKGLEPPTTWEEYVTVCQALTTQGSGGGPPVWGSLIEASGKAPQPAVKLLGWFYQNGGSIADAKNQPTINLDQNVEALQFVVDLVNKYKVAPPESAEMAYEDVHNLFIQGRGATAINWQYMVSLGNDPDQSVVAKKFSVAPVPAHVKKGVNIDNWALVVPTAAKSKDAAKKYVALALTKERQMDLLKSEGLVARLSAMNPQEPAVKAANPFIDAWLEEMKWATPQPKWKSLNEAWLRLSVAMNSAVTQSSTPKEALDQAQKEITELVNKG
jgi:multiple sugar transport system substrate-binding protein